MPNRTHGESHKPDAIHQKVTPSKELAAIIGDGPMERGQVTSKVWDYIKAHDLQSDEDGREIEADAALKKVVGRDRLSMFDLTRKVNEHLH